MKHFKEVCWILAILIFGFLAVYLTLHALYAHELITENTPDLKQYGKQQLLIAVGVFGIVAGLCAILAKAK